MYSNFCYKWKINGDCITRENFSNTTERKPYIFTYWDNVYYKTMPSFIKLCIDSMYKHCKDNFNIVVLDKDKIKQYITINDIIQKKLNKLKIYHKTDYYRFMLLQKYGGIWLDADTLVMRNLQPIINKLIKYDFIGFGCTGNICKNGRYVPSNGVLASKKNGIIISKIAQLANEKIMNHFDQRDDYYFLGKYLIWKILKSNKKYDKIYYHYDSSFSGCRDNEGKWITPNRQLLNHKINLLNENNLLFVFLYNSNYRKIISGNNLKLKF